MSIEYRETQDDSVPEGEYILNFTVMNRETGEERTVTQTLHDGNAITELRDLVRAGWFDDPETGQTDEATVSSIVDALLGAGESSAVAKGAQLRALVDADPDYVITGRE